MHTPYPPSRLLALSRRMSFILVLLVLAAFLVQCSPTVPSTSQISTPTATSSGTRSPTPRPPGLPINTPLPTETPMPTSTPVPTPTTQPTPAPAHFEPFGTVTLQPDFEVDGRGRNVDSIAFWEAPDPHDTLMFVTAKDNQLVEVWKYPFVDNEQAPLKHPSFGNDTQVNGIVVDQESDRLYVSISAPASTVSVFSLPQLEFIREFVEGSVNMKGEPNITMLKRDHGQKWVYISADNRVYIRDADTGAKVGQFEPAKGLETMLVDDFYQVIYIPDESDRTGVYAYHPDGTPYQKNDTNHFGEGVFQRDAEGIALYTCPARDGDDSGIGFIIVADQRQDQTDFEFFNRQTWEHLGTLNIAGVSNTDGIASTQSALPDYPLGLFAAIDDDTSTVGLGWDTIFKSTGLGCVTP